MKCLYEVLGVDRDVDEGGLKKAYRKLALQWHPDKNQANLQEAEERFKEIQNAYEILIDPHERSWYDSHRESILRSGERYQAGGGGFEGGQRPADEEDLYQYFTTAAFSGFGDGPRGFYGVYDSLFERLAKQEAEAHEQRSASDRKGKRPPGPFPRFGFSDAPWPEVAAFYASWAGFATVKDFAWADQYHTASAPNRRVRRAMEGENDKARRAAKREYNEAVRELVGFLRKRDKRVAAHQVEEARRREQRQAEDAARREAERQERLARAAAYQEAAWVRGEGGSEGDEESEEELAEEEQLVWYCMACEKHFKSAAAFDNHERSKKHLQQVELLRQVLEEEEAELGGAPLAAPSSDDEQLDGGSTLTSEEGSGSSSSEEEEAEIETETDQERGSVASSGGDSDASSATADGQSEGGTGRAGGQHAGRVQQRSEAEQPSEEEEGSSSEMGEDDMLARLVATQRPLSRQQQRRSQPDSGSEEEGSEEDVAAGSQGAGSAASGSSQQEEEEDEEKDELAQGTASQQPARHRHPADDVGALGQDLAAVELDAATASGGSGSDSDWGRKPASKHRGRRGKKRVSQRPAQQQQREPQEQQQHLSVEQPTVPQQVQGKLPAKEKRRQRQAAQRGAGQQVEELRCSLCRSEFATRNQLFKHLKTEHYG